MLPVRRMQVFIISVSMYKLLVQFQPMRTLSSHPLLHFFLAMALYPDIQKKAQAEIDAVIGTDRLPEFEDRPSLPFVEALYREVMRRKPVTPLGVAHASIADDVYNGYFIPDNSLFPRKSRSY
ncbi:Cytochrome P450 [Mycena sanguinolenta]|uniref:Cytochrome P450 n=1 Tax=Mycena sanguinolenta TaxID=230812 RepID=A0A8H7DIJ7_9AGAR|nr:Cytochrome P450 [Mycena sanguinolenta]